MNISAQHCMDEYRYRKIKNTPKIVNFLHAKPAQESTLKRACYVVAADKKKGTAHILFYNHSINLSREIRKRERERKTKQDTKNEEIILPT